MAWAIIITMAMGVTLRAAQLAELGRRIRLARLSEGIQVKVLATRSGISEQAIRNLERGRHDAYIMTVILIADQIGIDLGDLTAGLADVRDERLRALWRAA